MNDLRNILGIEPGKPVIMTSNNNEAVKKYVAENYPSVLVGSSNNVRECLDHIIKTSDGVDREIILRYMGKSGEEFLVENIHFNDENINGLIKDMVPESNFKLYGRNGEIEGILKEDNSLFKLHYIANGDYKIADVTIKNKLGMHARPSSSFVQTANLYPNEIYVRNHSKNMGDQILINNEGYSNGKSIMSFLMMEPSFGDRLKIAANGNNSTTVLNNLVDLINSKFGEE